MIRINFLLLCLLLAGVLAKTQLQVLSISNNPITIDGYISSSAEGGKIVYIRVIGHSLVASDLTVLIEDNPCNVLEDGITESMVVCETSAFPVTSTTQCKVTLKSKNKSFTFQGRCYILYSELPSIDSFYPSSAGAGQKITVVANNPTTSSQNQIKIGSYLCQRYNYNDNQTKECKLNEDVEGGHYNLTLRMDDGYCPRKKKLNRPTLIQGQNFQFTAIPTISSATREGNMGGQVVTIHGSGFSSHINNNSVTIDGNTCVVTASQSTKIECELKQKNNSLSSALQTNASTPIKNYHSGAGVYLQQYYTQITDLDLFISLSRNGDSIGTLLEEGISSQIGLKKSYSNQYYEGLRRCGFIWKGYFTAPTTGTYSFRGQSSNHYAMFLSSVYGSIQQTAEKFIYSNGSNTFLQLKPNTSKTVELITNRSYYVEVYFIHPYYSTTTGKLLISVEVPNDNTNLDYQLFQIEEITFTVDKEPQVVVFSMSGGVPGPISVTSNKLDSIGNVVSNTANITYGCTAYQFHLVLYYSLELFRMGGTIVTRFMYDVDGKQISDPFSASKIDYQVNVTYFRSQEDQNAEVTVTDINSNITFEQKKVRKHSLPIQGDLTVKLSGTYLKDGSLNNGISFPYGQSTQLKNYLQQLPGLQNTYFNQKFTNGVNKQIKWILAFQNYYQPVDIVFDGSSLTGGVSSPTITRTIERNSSSSINFDIIDQRFLNIPADKPSVLVTVNNIPAICKTDCSFTFKDLLKITNTSLSGRTLTTILNNPVAINGYDVKIKIKDNDCSVKNVKKNPTDIQITCDLQIDSDGAPILPAGSLVPEVFIDNIGFVQPINTVPPIEVPFVVTSLVLIQGSNEGGDKNTLIGSGFVGKGSSDGVILDQGGMNTFNITITICNQVATIGKTVAHNKITFTVPSCPNTGPHTVTVSNGIHSDSSLIYTYIGTTIVQRITDVVPKTSNPKLKKVMTISGISFGTNLSNIKIYLANEVGRAYESRVLSVQNNTITCGLSGGLPGQYTVEVYFLDTKRSAVPDTPGVNFFTYSFTVSSISPASGGFYGGNLLTITGSNFLTGLGQTQVFIGNAINWLCLIESISQTQITCLTPLMHPLYVAGNIQRVRVASRLSLFNDCPGNNCNFIYDNYTSSPLLTSSSSPVVTAVEGLTLTGQRLTANSTCSIVLRAKTTNQIVELPTSSCNSTNASINIIPSTLSYGHYYISIKDQNGVLSNPLSIQVLWNLGTLHLTSTSIAGGYNYLSGGSGYPLSLDVNSLQIVVSYISSYAEITSCCENNILQFIIPGQLPLNTSTIKFYSPAIPSYIHYSPSQASTPYATIVNPTNLTIDAGTTTFSLNRTSTFGPSVNSITLVSVANSADITIANLVTVDSFVTNFTVTLNAGSYKVVINSTQGYYYNNDIINVKTSTIVSNPVEVSFAGGIMILTGSHLSPSSHIIVNGIKGNIIVHTSTYATYQIPQLISPSTETHLKMAQNKPIELSMGTVISVDPLNQLKHNAFDSNINNFYSSEVGCWIGIDFGADLSANVNKFRYYPAKDLKNIQVKKIFIKSEFQGSNDMVNWITLGIVEGGHSGWNFVENIFNLPENNTDKIPYRYIRYKDGGTSKCQLAQIELIGTLQYSGVVDPVAQTSQVTYHDSFNHIVLDTPVTYYYSQTPIVNDINPLYGDISGGYPITLTGQNFGSTNNIYVEIDGVQCIIVSNNGTQIVCTVGQKDPTSTVSNFIVKVQGKLAILREIFKYVLKWSSINTWGIDLPPVDGDLIYVPPGMILLIDQDTPLLQGIAAKNSTIIIANNSNIIIRAGFITIVGGSFIAGTQKNPLHSNLTIELYGEARGAQQPLAGNKGIFCLECKFSMYGIPRMRTWTTIEATVMPGDNSLVLSEDVDWQPGQEIVVSATGFNQNESQKVIISSRNNRIVTIKDHFNNKHLSSIETHGNEQFMMKAEVGLLSRNIKVTGDSSTINTGYGAHLKMSGLSSNGFEGQIAYSEFTLCGQVNIYGRYCIYFHMNGESATSYARGNSVHESFGRVVTIHSTHLLTVQKNVGFRARGHNFFLHDGSQTKNIIKNNLAVSSLSISSFTLSDTTVSSFMITNPANDVIGNRASGSEYYGFWFKFNHTLEKLDFKDQCQYGIPLGIVTQNVAHSIYHSGIRINQYYAKTYPCEAVRNDNNVDPWSQNPSLPSVFSNFLIYKVRSHGVHAEKIGNLIFDNFTIAESGIAGLQIEEANFTRQSNVVKDSLIIGNTLTNYNAPTNSIFKSGIITPRTGSTALTGVKFYNFPLLSIVLVICSKCNEVSYFTTIGTQIFVNKIAFGSIEGEFIRMLSYDAFVGGSEVVYDEDGSLIFAFNGMRVQNATYMRQYRHIFDQHTEFCFNTTNPQRWSISMMCTHRVIIRRVYFFNCRGSGASSIRVAPIVNQIISQFDANSSSFSISSALTYIWDPYNWSYQPFHPKKQMRNTWSFLFAAGKKYIIFFKYSLDIYFTSISIKTTSTFRVEDPGIVFIYRHKQNSQKFDVVPVRGGTPVSQAEYIQQSTSFLDPLTCINGDYYHNDASSQRMLSFCQSGKGRTKYEHINIKAVPCNSTSCTSSGTGSNPGTGTGGDSTVVQNPTCNAGTKETIVRKWTNASMWPAGVVPQAGDNVNILCDWTVLIDISPSEINILTVDGDLIVDDSIDINLTANIINIRRGSLVVGSQSLPFTHSFTIQINGNLGSSSYQVDRQVSGQKMISVTGTLQLYGTFPSTVITYLTQTVFQGGNIIQVSSTTGWKVGDSISLSPSFSTYSEYQQVVISSFNSNGTVTVQPAVKFTHYGASSLTFTSYGSLDTRTRVGHLSRNVKIVAGQDISLGYTIYVYQYIEATKTLSGNMILSGVELRNGGQLQWSKAVLQFLSLSSTQTSSVSSSSFVNCQFECISVRSSSKVKINKNVLFKVKVAGLRFSDANVRSLTFSDNLVVGVSSRGSVDLVACVVSTVPNDPTYANTIMNNYCQGSQGYGFAFPHIRCTELANNPMAYNTAGSCDTGFIFNKINDTCLGFSYITAYACRIGQIAGSPDIKTLMFMDFILADNQRSATLKFGGIKDHLDNTAFFRNSYIAAISRPNCSECYPSIICSNLTGLKMLTVSENGERISGYFKAQFDLIDQSEVFDAKVYMENVQFDNFRQSYSTGFASEIVNNCASNFMMKPHSTAVSAVAGHYLTNVQAVNSDQQSYVSCQPLDQKYLGLQGGCGEMQCTGRSNYLVQDLTGSFFGFKGTLVPNNKVVGNNQLDCTFSSVMNGHLCRREDFGILEYQSKARDYNSRVIWPVSLTSNTSNYTTLTSAWRQWSYRPVNRRLSRFLSVVKLQTEYNVTFSDYPPWQMHVQLQRHTLGGNSSNWVVLMLTFSHSNSIRIFVNNIRITPIITTDTITGSIRRQLNSSLCGDNVYFFDNKTIKFVVIEDPNCLVRVSLADSIQLTTHFAISPTDFFVDSFITSFIDNLCALLGIYDYSRVKIVGVHTGSAVVNTVIEASNTTTSTNSSTSNVATIHQTLTTAINSGSFASTMQNNLGTQLLQVSQQYYQLQPATEGSQESGSIVMFMIVGIVMVVLVAVIIAVLICFKRRLRAKVYDLSEEGQQESVYEDVRIENSGDLMAMSQSMMSQSVAESSEREKDLYNSSIPIDRRVNMPVYIDEIDDLQ